MGLTERDRRQKHEKQGFVFPWDAEVRITPKSVVTDEFRQKIRDAFQNYTYGTSEDYRYQDKLTYINLIREENCKVDAEELINEYIKDQLCNQGEFSMDDFKDFETLGTLINAGIDRSLKNWHHWSGDHHLDKPACKFVQAAIEEVMNYPEADKTNE